ncbi:TlpA family protein disulfide reductase [Saliphagus sp. GCM10025334]
MRRRDLLAGLGSLGVLATGGVVATTDVSSLQSRFRRRFGDEADQLEVETVDAQGSEAGTIALPSLEQPTFIDFFGTWCGPCIKQMPALVEAHERLGDEVLFVSVTNENVGSSTGASITEAELADWWAEHDGNWTVGVDRTVELAERYGLQGYPYAVAVDEYGFVQWSEGGIKSADELVAGIEHAI